jgi:hypothetical protein
MCSIVFLQAKVFQKCKCILKSFLKKCLYVVSSSRLPLRKIFVKIHQNVALYSNCKRALTFENFCISLALSLSLSFSVSRARPLSLRVRSGARRRKTCVARASLSKLKNVTRSPRRQRLQGMQEMQGMGRIFSTALEETA